MVIHAEACCSDLQRGSGPLLSLGIAHGASRRHAFSASSTDVINAGSGAWLDVGSGPPRAVGGHVDVGRDGDDWVGRFHADFGQGEVLEGAFRVPVAGIPHCL
jgi:hypothetical protein